MVRVYEDEKTGEEVSVLVLYGLATSVRSHIPEVCYPAAGYRQIKAPPDHELTVPGSTPARFRTVYFSKSGSVVDEVEVCYTFLHNKEWLPDVEGRWKMFRLHPGMFKIQLAAPGRQPKVETLLGELVGEINRRLAEKSGRAVNETTPAQTRSSQK